MSNKDMDLEHSFVEKRNDGWMEVRLTKPLHHLENHESLEVNLTAASYSSRMGIIVEGMEFRPLVHDGSYLMAERSANGKVIGTTHLHGTSDHDDKNEEEYWEKKLPHDYPHLIKMSDIPLKYTTKKELYLLFSHGFLANNGQLWFSTCKLTRGICSILAATHVFSENPFYDKPETVSLPESRFKEVKIVGLNKCYVFTCRLESFMFSPDHYNYAWYLVFKLEDGRVLPNDGPIFRAVYNLGGNDGDGGAGNYLSIITTTLKKPKEESGSSKRIDIGPGMSKHNYVDSRRSWVEKRDDSWLEARLTKPLLKRHLENLNELRIDLSLVGSKVFRFNWMIVASLCVNRV
ncbi:hypothetical protein Tco_0589048 [Tanacetum coccineum]